MIDLLLVIDNSSTTADEQAKLVPALEILIEQLDLLAEQLQEGPNGLDINIMVTSSDTGHPLCPADLTPGYVPKQGAPQDLPCIERLGDFSTVPELCEALCPFPIAPVDPFVHRSGWSGEITNVPGNEVVGALNCLVPQGINGCEYGSPLEAMLRALDPAASWNQGEHPFLRPDAMLAIAIVSDGYDCSVQAPDGYAHFSVPAPSPAICWNAGVDCGTPDAEGVYADCTTVDGDVLHPIGRYSDFLDALVANGKPVVMLDLLGVPSAGAEPIYRDWREGVYPVGDLLPGEQTSAADKQFEFGIGPACVGHDELGELTNQALPDVRMTRLCESFDADGQVRCCIESSCEGDYTGAIGCLTGVIQTAVELD